MRARRPNLSSSLESAPLTPSLQHLFPASPPLPALAVEVDALEQLRLSAENGLRALRHNGLEVGGILVGHWKWDEPTGPQVCVTRQIAIEIDYESGPRFIASTGDIEKFRERIEEVQLSGDFVVGWWRSQTFGQNLALSQSDFVLTRELFQAIPAVVLVILPSLEGSSFAALHLVTGDSVESSPPFPFERDAGMSAGLSTTGDAEDAVSRGDDINPPNEHLIDASLPAPLPAPTENVAEPQAEESAEPIAATERPLPATLPPPVDDDSKTRWRPSARKSAIYAALAACLIVGFLLTQAPRLSGWFPSAYEELRLLSMSATKSLSPNDVSDDRVDSTAIAGPVGIELHVAWLRGGLQLEWDRQSTIVQSATEGKLEVDDGDVNKTIVLSAADVRSGAITWFPSTDSVRFELTVTSDAGEAKGLLQAHGFRQDNQVPPGGSAESATLATQRPLRSERFAEERIRPAPPQISTPVPGERTVSRGQPVAPVPPAEAPPGSQEAPIPDHQIATLENVVPPHRVTPPATTPGAGQRSGVRQSASLPQCRSTITAIGYYEKRSRLGFLKVLRKLPLVPGGGTPAEKSFVAPRTIAATCPDLASAHLLRHPEWIDVIAEINGDGRVEAAAATGSNEHTYVALRTVESVKSWRFQPATLADRRVESEVRLRVYWSYPPSESAASAAYRADRLSPRY